MRKVLFLLLAMLMAVPSSYAQKMTKEEKKAAAKLAFDAAVESINNKSWVIVPSGYMTSDGILESNIDDAVFLSVEGEDMFAQGYCVCDNGKNNVSHRNDYEVITDKKGNIKVIITVHGNFWKGTYTVKMKNGSNEATIIFDPQGSSKREFSGPIVPLAGAKYTKRANPL